MAGIASGAALARMCRNSYGTDLAPFGGVGRRCLPNAARRERAALVVMLRIEKRRGRECGCPARSSAERLVSRCGERGKIWSYPSFGDAALTASLIVAHVFTPRCEVDIIYTIWPNITEPGHNK